MRKSEKRKRHQNCYQFKNAFSKSIERRIVRKLTHLSKKDVCDQLLDLSPLKKTEKFLERSENLNDSFLNRDVSRWFNIPTLFSFRYYLEFFLSDKNRTGIEFYI